MPSPSTRSFTSTRSPPIPGSVTGDTGRQLIEDAIERARSVGAASVTLEVRVSNLTAREFYRSYGFREAFRRKNYYQDGEDAFALVLSPAR